MRIFNVEKIRGVLLCIILVLPLLTGCANECLENQELVQIEQKWEAVMQNKNNYVAKIEIASYVTHSLWSSEVSVIKYQSIEDPDDISSLIDLLKQQNVVFESIPGDIDGLTTHLETRKDLKTIQLLFLDSEGMIITGMCIYEDNNADIVKGNTVTDPITHTHFVSFSDQTFQKIQSVYKSVE